MVKHIESSAKETGKEIQEQNKSSKESKEENPFIKKILHIGKYLAISVAGLGVGLYTARHGARFMNLVLTVLALKLQGRIQW
jgi:hypothetical protein